MNFGPKMVLGTEFGQVGRRVRGGCGDHQSGGGAGGWRGNVPGISLIHTWKNLMALHYSPISNKNGCRIYSHNTYNQADPKKPIGGNIMAHASTTRSFQAHRLSSLKPYKLYRLSSHTDLIVDVKPQDQSEKGERGAACGQDL